MPQRRHHHQSSVAKRPHCHTPHLPTHPRCAHPRPYRHCRSSTRRRDGRVSRLSAQLKHNHRTPHFELRGRSSGLPTPPHTLPSSRRSTVGASSFTSRSSISNRYINYQTNDPSPHHHRLMRRALLPDALCLGKLPRQLPPTHQTLAGGPAGLPDLHINEYKVNTKHTRRFAL